MQEEVKQLEPLAGHWCVMQKETGELKEMTYNLDFGQIIWLEDYDAIPKSAKVGKFVIFSDDKRFKEYESLGNL